MPVVGTAGHVDHGKSTLVQALTGRDPDRWAEEKERGLTIDLGFSWARLPSGVEVSFVDVPGHERFAKNMLAGIEMIDLAMFVVAADEGWMPQSEEHLAVLDLLGVRYGAVALTKVDRVDTETVELAALEVAERLAGTTLEGMPIVPVSGTTGEGVTDLMHALDAGLARPTATTGRPRIWVDRSFTVGGAGTVITGTLTGGALAVGEKISFYPGGAMATVRGLQSHERDVTRAEPGTRVAVNLRGLERADVTRGDMLGIPGEWDLSDRFSVSLRLARYVDEVSAKGAYQAHIGSGAHLARIGPAEEGRALIYLGSAVPLQAGDRFILRDTGRRQVVAGGVVLDLDPRAGRAGLEDGAEIEVATTPDEVADALLRIRGIDTLWRLSAHSGGGSPSQGTVIGDRALSAPLVEEVKSKMVGMIEAEHLRHPLRGGMDVATLAERLGLDRSTVEHLIASEPSLIREGPDVGLRSHDVVMTGEQEAAWASAKQTLRAGLAVPSQGQLGLDSELIHLLLRLGELIRVSDQLVILPDQAEAIEGHIARLDDGFTVAEFRDATGLSRKHSVPFLEWADDHGLTARRGDLRFRMRSDG